LITDRPDLLHKVDPDDWLWRLKARAETVRKRLHQLEIAVDEDVLRVHPFDVDGPPGRFVGRETENPSRH
jgi:hypothetical protein